MRFLDRFRTKPAKQEAISAKVNPSVAIPPVSPNFGTWVDPEVTAPTEEWERRLNAYAQKCADQLREAGVPLFRSKWPRDGKDAYRDAFWLIACDVEWARRQWAASYYHSPHEPLVGYPPPVKKGEYTGSIRATSLLLTKSGILCTARTEGFITRSGGVDDREMDLLFSDIGRPMSLFRTHDWGWNNRGRWRRDPKSDSRSYGVGDLVHTIVFEERYYRKTPYPNDGRDTSAALTNFVKTDGSVRWPRGFISFDYD